MQKQPLWTRDFIKICLSSLFLFITYYALVATLPVYIMDTLRGGEQEVGLALTAFIIAAVIVRPIAGKWVDELGKKKVAILASALFMVSTFTYFGVISLFFLLALRFVHGLSFGFATTAMAAIATDLVPEERKGEGIGYYALFMNLAMVIGPFVGLMIMNKYSFSVLCMLISVFAIVSFACEGLTKVQEAQAAVKRQHGKKFHWKNFIEPGAMPISLAACLMSFAYSGLLSFIPVYAKDIGASEVSSYFFVIYAIMIVLSRPFTGKLFDRLGEHVVIYPSIILYAIGLVLLSQAHGPAMFLMASAVIGLGYGSVFPSFQAIAIKSSPTERRGLATGTYYLLFDLGMGVGSFVLGIVASSMNFSSMYMISSLIVAFAGVVYYSLYHRATSKKLRKESERLLLSE
ncbi:MFS transporter [Brevibacillus choshinensis]|uniref:MFS transporter n=1 Tax=Brevibacillus choshinensis TaxID=54911 RepID=UPI002E1BB2BC|nr:MFS transporter [Brevibacillus choshinensis]